jgi:hypothetical protein
LVYDAKLIAILIHLYVIQESIAEEMNLDQIGYFGGTALNLLDTFIYVYVSPLHLAFHQAELRPHGLPENYKKIYVFGERKLHLCLQEVNCKVCGRYK